MSQYFDFTDDVTDYSDDDLDYRGQFFDFVGELTDYSPDDFDYVSEIFTFDPDPLHPPSVYFVFEGGEEVIPADPEHGIILSFRDPKALNPFNAKTIAGLDPGDILSRNYKSSFGGNFYNLVIKDRTLVIKMGLNPDYADHETFSQLRDHVYKVLSSSKVGAVDVYFKNGNDVVAVITGFTSKIASNLFEADQELELAIACGDSVLRAPTPTEVNLDILGFTDFVIGDDTSTSPHGLTFVYEFTADAANFTIEDLDGTWEFVITPLLGFNDGDVLYFSNEVGRRYAYITRGATVIDMMIRISPTSNWPIIFPGENHFNLSPAGIWHSISYYKTYWGV